MSPLFFYRSVVASYFRSQKGIKISKGEKGVRKVEQNPKNTPKSLDFKMNVV